MGASIKVFVVLLIIVALTPYAWWNPSLHGSSCHQESKAETIEKVETTERSFPIDMDALDFRYLSHAVISEEHKLLICAIPKIASSEWKKLFLRLQGDINFLEEPWWKGRNLTTLYKVGMRRAMEILTDETWTKGVFFRDPLKRLMSCYLDKFTNGTERSLKYSVKVFGSNHTLSFAEFLERVAEGGAPQNVHWRPQADICQIGQLWHLYNFYGNFENIEDHSRLLLQRAGLWEEFGAHGWGGGPMFHINQAAHRSEYKYQTKGDAQLLRASTSMPELSSALIRRVRVAYRRDYALFGQVAALTARSSPDRASPFRADIYFPPVPDALADQPDAKHQGFGQSQGHVKAKIADHGTASEAGDRKLMLVDRGPPDNDVDQGIRKANGTESDDEVFLVLYESPPQPKI